MKVITILLIIILLINLIVFSSTYENFDDETNDIEYEKKELDIWKNKIGNWTEETKTNDKLAYQNQVIDIEYHEDPEIIEKKNGYGIDLKPQIIYDPVKQSNINIRIPKILSLPIYNEPGSNKYGYDQYVPTYEDHIYFTAYND